MCETTVNSPNNVATDVAKVRRQTEAAIKLSLAIRDVIKEANSIPSGYIYATVMGSLSLDEYEFIIDLLVEAGLVRRELGHVLTYVGPK